MNNRILIILVIFLGAIAAYLYYGSTTSTIKPELRDFAVKDTASITKIFLADKAQKTLTLTRSIGGPWKVNGEFYARKDLINVLLKTIQGLEVKSPVSKASRDGVVKRLASGATKVEIYQNDGELVKVYYVGGATQNTMGTYMLIEGSSEPFITHLPSFFGYLTTRYVTNQALWRDKTFVSLQFKDIKSVQIEFPGDRKYSFSLVNKGNWDFELKALASDSVIDDYDTVAVRVYLTGFNNIQFEGFERSKEQGFVDSIFNATPVHILTIETLDGVVSRLEAFLKPDRSGKLDIDGNPVLFDVDRVYGRINGGSELVTLQFFVFDNVIFGLPGFLKGSSNGEDTVEI